MENPDCSNQESNNFQPMEGNIELILRAHNVKKVVDYRLDNGKRFYKVKWESSWEDEDTLTNYQSLVNQFWSFIDRVKFEDHHPSRKKPRLGGEFEKENTTNFQFVDYPSDGNQRKSSSDEGPHCDSSKLTTLAEVTHNQRTALNSPLGQHITKDKDGNVVVHVQPGEIPKQLNTAHSLKKVPLKMTFVRTDASQLSLASPVSSSSNNIPTEATAILPQPTAILTENDVKMNWDNQYVAITFHCRICKEEQPFCFDEKGWKDHFVTTHADIADSQESDNPTNNNKDGEQMSFIKDTTVPWIRKVEYLIQKWGVNRYVRMAFVCRICGKEQKAEHTGNWRNHYMAHSKHSKHKCAKCSKYFKTNSGLQKHTEHSTSACIKKIPIICSFCPLEFDERDDCKLHMLTKHNINIDNVNQFQESQRQQVHGKLLTYISKNSCSKQQVHGKLLTYISKNSCSKGATESTSLKVHSEELISSSDSKSKLVSSLKYNISCKGCSKTFQTNVEVKEHSCSAVLSPKLQTCKICQKGFRRKADLQSHIASEHFIGMEQPTKVAPSLQRPPPAKVKLNFPDKKKKEIKYLSRANQDREFSHKHQVLPDELKDGIIRPIIQDPIPLDERPKLVSSTDEEISSHDKVKYSIQDTSLEQLSPSVLVSSLKQSLPQLETIPQLETNKKQVSTETLTLLSKHIIAEDEKRSNTANSSKPESEQIKESGYEMDIDIEGFDLVIVKEEEVDIMAGELS